MQADKTPSFFDTQHAFTQYIRDPESCEPPSDIEKRRIDIYRDLFFNNISGVLSDAFPVLKQILSKQQWNELCYDFFSRHQSHSPYFSEISEEFLQYLQHERSSSGRANNDHPFLLELAHYEWTELYVSIAEDNNEQPKPITDPLNQVLTLANTALTAAYTFPVHKISPDFLPTQAPEQPTYLVIYRTQENHSGFLVTTTMTHALLSAFANNNDLDTQTILLDLATQLQHPNPDVIIEGGINIIKDFSNRGIIVAT